MAEGPAVPGDCGLLQLSLAGGVMRSALGSISHILGCLPGQPFYISCNLEAAN